MSKPARSAISADAHELRRARGPCRRGPSPSGSGCAGDQGTAEAAITGQLPRRRAARPSPPSRAGSSPSRRNGRAGSRFSPPSRRGRNRRCRFQAGSCSGAYSPVQPGEMRPSGADAGHLDIDEPGAALGALGVVDEVPVVGQPSTALYWSIGETTTRFFSFSSRSRKGANIGAPRHVAGCPACALEPAPRRRPARPCRAGGGSRG